jgi:hypothetical protein
MKAKGLLVGPFFITLKVVENYPPMPPVSKNGSVVFWFDRVIVLTHVDLSASSPRTSQLGVRQQHEINYHAGSIKPTCFVVYRREKPNQIDSIAMRRHRNYTVAKHRFDLDSGSGTLGNRTPHGQEAAPWGIDRLPTRRSTSP